MRVRAAGLVAGDWGGGRRATGPPGTTQPHKGSLGATGPGAKGGGLVWTAEVGGARPGEGGTAAAAAETAAAWSAGSRGEGREFNEAESEATAGRVRRRGGPAAGPRGGVGEGPAVVWRRPRRRSSPGATAPSAGGGGMGASVGAGKAPRAEAGPGGRGKAETQAGGADSGVGGWSGGRAEAATGATGAGSAGGRHPSVGAEARGARDLARVRRDLRTRGTAAEKAAAEPEKAGGGSAASAGGLGVGGEGRGSSRGATGTRPVFC
uniref:Uncharacterized protein n=1 Tax=Human herpesvirus 2 TaxID=10310 RepID=A0A481TWZ0_HHV2|nr:hypothetical protein [Human alphaherpesvirus 2]